MKSLITALGLCLTTACSPTHWVSQGDQGDDKVATKSFTNLCELQGQMSASDSKIDLKKIADQLEGDGVEGEVHGAVKDTRSFVFTWRKSAEEINSPADFFINMQMPLVTKDPALLEKLNTLQRHDRIRIKGHFIKNASPLKHINLTDLEVVRVFASSSPDYDYVEGFAEDLLASTEKVVKVHAVAAEGSVLVVEYGDRIFPVFNSRPEWGRELYRNDKIQLRYRVRRSPNRPPHIEVDPEDSEPVRLLDQMACGNGEPIELKGELLMYPKSPQINRNVYAIKTLDEDGIARGYTLIGETDVFLELNEKLEKVWQEMDQWAVSDRNKYLNSKIIVSAKGLKNVISPTQANPQIVLEKVEDVKVEIQTDAGSVKEWSDDNKPQNQFLPED